MPRRVWIVLGILGALVLAGGIAGAVLLVTRGLALARMVVATPSLPTATPRPSSEEGLVIVAVEPGSPAAQAGLQRGDILLSVDGQSVNTLADLRAVLGRHRPGETVTVTVRRGESTRAFSITLGERNGRAYLGVQVAAGPGPLWDLSPRWGRPWGPWPFGPWSRAGSGALILRVEPGSPAAHAGLQTGDWITAVDGQDLAPGADLSERIAAHRPGDRVVLTVWRPGVGEHTVSVSLGEHPEKPGQAYLGVRYVMLPMGWRPGPTPTPTPGGSPS